jgi:hypothetical protein
MLHVAKASTAQNGDKTQVKVKVANNGNETRVHLFAFNFMPSNSQSLSESFI